MTERFDIAVLGGGPGGYVAALRAALRGAKVCCIEAGHLGGTCLNVGCIPTKAMLHASGLVHDLAGAGPLGVRTGKADVDGAAFMRRVATTVAGLRKGVQDLLKARKVHVIRGRGRLAARDAIEVRTDAGPTHVQANAIIIATGSRPVRPDFLPWDSGCVWTTDEATTAENLPQSVLIIGGGAIGCEFATLYAELGIPTTLVEMLDHLAGDLDADASRAIARSLQKRRVEIRTGCQVVAARADEAGMLAELQDGSALRAAMALVCVGRRANVEEIGLEALGVRLAGGVIVADDRCRTSVDGLYAVGDVAETRQYAHLASRMGIVAADNATGHAASDDRRVVPIGVYTHPQVATVGLSEAEARHSHPSARAARFPLRASGLAQASEQTDGLVKLVADGETGGILGATIIAPHATDLIQEVALAMQHALTVEQVAETIHPHPTFVEAIGEAAESWLGLPLHSLR